MEMQKILPDLISAFLPPRPALAHKGDFGRVLVVAGSRTMCGAGFLCAKSALTAGAGLVFWALPESMQPYFAAALPEVITLPLPETRTGEISEHALEILGKCIKEKHISLAAVGMGMGKSPLIYPFLTQVALPMLVDADGLNELAAEKTDLSAVDFSRCIFTPHAGEMARLLGTEAPVSPQARLEQVTALARLTQGVAVLKGAQTLVCGGNSVYQNTTGSSALAKGGAGDVLSGIIAGLWAQWGAAEGFNMSCALKAALCGVYLHGLAGDLAAAARSGYAVLAQDIIGYLPQAFLTAEKGAL